MSVVAGSLLALIALGLIAAGVAGLVWNDTHRDGGYLTSSTAQFHSVRYALSADRVRVGGDIDWGCQGSPLDVECDADIVTLGPIPVNEDGRLLPVEEADPTSE